MTTISPDQLIGSLRWRYATKRFDPQRRIPADTWSTLELALVLTPSSYGLQPWRFLVIQDPKLRESLVPHSWNQRQVADASHLVVMAVRKRLDLAYVDHFIASVAAARNVTVESLGFYRRMIVSDVIEGERSPIATEWAIRQAYIALGNFMTAAALLGVDTCPMEGFVAAQYDEILGLEPRGLTTAVLCPAGYRSETDKYATIPKVRFSVAEMIEYR